MVPPTILPAAERSEAERRAAQHSRATGKTGAPPDTPLRLNAELPAKAKRRTFTAEYRKRILAEAAAHNGGELPGGVYLFGPLGRPLIIVHRTP